MMASWKMGIKRYKSYPIDLIVEISFPFITMVLLPSIWLWLGSIGTYSPRDLFLYTAGSTFLSFLLGSLAFIVERSIKTGYFEIYQSKPLEYGKHLIFNYYGEITPRLLTTILVFMTVYILLGGVNLVHYITGVLLSIAFYTLLELSIGYLAAWYYKVWGIHFLLIYFPSLLLGGSLIPLDLLPGWIQRISLFLPYRYLHYEVASTLLGRSSNYLPLLLWTAVILMIERFLYKKMLRRLEVWGG